MLKKQVIKIRYVGESNYIYIEFIEHNVDLWGIIGA